MKNAEFVALLTANANKTDNIRVYSKPWPSGARRLPQNIQSQIGRLVSFLQDKPIMALKEDCMFCSLDMVIVPFVELRNTTKIVGQPLHVAFNIDTWEIVNNTKSMLDMGLIVEEEIEVEGLDPPLVYGNFTDYQPTTSFMAIASTEPFLAADVFAGALDASDDVLQAPIYHSYLDAQKYLNTSPKPHQLIAELIRPKSDRDEMLKKGISAFVVKSFLPDLGNLQCTPKVEILMHEHNHLDEELLLQVAKKEEEVVMKEIISVGSRERGTLAK